MMSIFDFLEEHPEAKRRLREEFLKGQRIQLLTLLNRRVTSLKTGVPLQPVTRYFRPRKQQPAEAMQ